MENLKEVIKNFVKHPDKEMALMINGQWGVGKTYFLKKLNPHKFDKEKIIFVSLKGIKNTTDISRKVLAATWTFTKKIGLFNNVISNLAGYFSKGIVSISATDFIEMFFEWKKLNNTLLIFDDFERISISDISYPEVLFFIHSTFIEEKTCSVIIVGNEEELAFKKKSKNIHNSEQKDIPCPDEEQYQEAKDKVIENTVHFEQRLIDMFPEYLKNRYPKMKETLSSFLLSNDVNLKILKETGNINIRKYNRLFDAFIQIYNEIGSLSPKISSEHENKFLEEVLLCLREVILIRPNRKNPPSLEDVYNSEGFFIDVDLFPSVTQLIQRGWMDVEMLREDLERRTTTYAFNDSIGDDYSTIIHWFSRPYQKVLDAFSRLVKKSSSFTTYDLFLETSRYLKWFFDAKLMDETLYHQYQKELLVNFKDFLMHLDDINLSITGRAAEEEFIDVLRECKNLKEQEKLKEYEKVLFFNRDLPHDPIFAEFVRSNPLIVLKMYTDHAQTISDIHVLYAHTSFLVGCIKQMPPSKPVKEAWSIFINKLINNISDPVATAVLEVMVTQVLSKEDAGYQDLLTRLEQKKFLLKNKSTF